MKLYPFMFRQLISLSSFFVFIIFQQTLFAQDNAMPRIREFQVPLGTHPHDVAPARNGSVWYTAQQSGELGLLDPLTNKTHHIALGNGSAPHGVIVGPDGAPWITDGGLNAIVRVDPNTKNVTLFPLPGNTNNANLNTATFDHNEVLWFTGQSGIYGRLDPRSGTIEVLKAPGGQGPYGISTTPNGEVYFASLAGSYIARINLETGNATVLEPPQRTKERDVSGLILQEMYGSPSGMSASWVCITMLPMNGKNGNCQVKNLNLTQFLLMITIWSGSVILVLMLSCGLIHT